MVIGFKNFNKNEILIEDIVWGIPSDSIIEKSERPLTKLMDIDENYNFLPDPPKNNSDKAEIELELLEKINRNLMRYKI